MEWLTLATFLGNTVIPPLYNLVKGIFFKGKVSENPEGTMDTLATTKPEVLAPYVEGLAKYYNALTVYFNRDVSGIPSVWVINLRACIRPFTVIMAFAVMFIDTFGYFKASSPVLLTCSGVIGNWIGTRIDFK